MLNDKKNVIWNFLGAGTNAFVSLVLAIIVTRINGVDNAGVFIYSFAIASMLYVIGVYAGRTFQVTDINDKLKDTDYIYNRIITCIIMIIVSVLFVIIKGYNYDKAIIFVILCAFKMIEAFSEGLYAIIQKNELLYKVGISMSLKAVTGIIVFLVIDIITKNLILSSISLLLVNIIYIIIYDYINLKKIVVTKEKYSSKKNWLIIKTGFFTFALTFLSLYLINAPRNAIDDIQAEDIQAIFGIIIMPATIMGLVGQFILQPVLTRISKAIKEKDKKQLSKIIIQIELLAIGLGIVVLVMSAIFGIPLLEVIYGIELSEYYFDFLIIIFGAIFYCLGLILSTVLIAMRKTFIQFIIFVTLSIVSTIMSYVLVGNVSVLGASITYMTIMMLQVLLFTIVLVYNIKILVKN